MSQPSLFNKLFLFFLLLLVNPVSAEMAYNLGVGDIKATTLGHAVTANPPGVSAVWFNPAALARLEGRRLDFHVLAVDLNSTVKFTAPPGYEVFGFSDDPLVCNSSAESSSTCSDFKPAFAEIAGTAFYVPIKDDVVHGPAPPVGPIPLPPGFSIKPAGSRFTFANMITAPIVGGIYREDDDPGRYLGKEAAIQVINYLNPTVGYEVNNEWSFGVGIGFSYGAFALDTDVRAPNEIMAFMRILDESVCAPFGDAANLMADLILMGLCNTQESLGPFKTLASLNVKMEDTYSPNYTLGIQWQNGRKFSWGAVYHSETSFDLTGPFEIKYSESARDTLNSISGSATGALALGILGIQGGIPDSIETGNVEMQFIMPAHFQTGIQYKIIPSLALSVDVSWINTSAMKDFTIEFDRRSAGVSLGRILAPGSDANSISIQTGMADTVSWSMGIEYQLNRRISLRLGYDPRDSIVSGDKITPLVPLNDATVYSAGLGYRWDHDTDIDFGVSRLISIYNAPADTACLSNCTGIENLIYNPYAGLDIESTFDLWLVGLAFRTSW